MKSRFIFMVALLVSVNCFSSVYAGNSEIDDFFFDGCSSIAPEGTPQDPDMWCECCLEHDIAYWKGGTWTDRLNADLELKRCVTEKSGCALIGNTYYLGVRVGGSPYLDTPYRWGYGWDYGRGYKRLTAAEAIDANEKLQLYMDEYPDPCADFAN